MIKDEYLDQIRSGKESISLEFKEASQDIPKNVYDTVCSFSNRNGGNIYLGVADDGMVTGVNPEKILQMKKDFVTAIQSPIKINPPLYLDINEFDLDEKKFYMFLFLAVHKCIDMAVKFLIETKTLILILRIIQF